MTRIFPRISQSIDQVIREINYANSEMELSFNERHDLFLLLELLKHQLSTMESD